MDIRSADGTSLGTLQLIPTADETARLVGTLTRLPAGRHGIHLHAVGRCDGTAFAGAGGHFNASGKKHGLRNSAGPHDGDAPSIEADGSGRAAVDVRLAHASVTAGAANGLFDADGAAVVIHANDDDQMTDPSGNTGARIACGVVRRR